ncbi:ATP-dependent acyl-CoA ligase [Rhizorhabdus dicambivorans]|uniref:ATP-dependent acyl-CoA ligase n=2 Tax=Rhizorhabdus dicambivorans TaxID=1850238 RepID=A0A2A4FW88_9SPHN|nr:ATP-dependent acyl-CoA ligase [Rhizorhabdus dicambivorans]PCE41956.1 ATP-dependent acyl-CoA ligase [Rhizorhabdus dicambivorans]
MRGMDIPWLLDSWADRVPDKPFLIWEPFDGETKTWSYDRFRSRARSLAAGLAGRGIRQGDFVLLHLDNSPEFLISWFACAILGAIVVSTNTRSVARDLSYFAQHTGAVCAITQPAFACMVRDACPALGFVAVTDNDAGKPADPVPEAPMVRFADLFSDIAGCPERIVDPFADLGVQFTSGTTSRPKAVLWTHANGLWGGMISSGHMHLQHDDVALVFLPMFHTNAQSYSMLSTLWCGATLVLQPRFSASRFWEVSLKHKTTWLSTIPFTVKALEGIAVPRHHYRFWGTSVHMPDASRQFGIPTLGWWGMTETLSQGITCDAHHLGPALSIGRAAPEYAIAIRKPDGAIAGPGERGRLYVRGVRGVSLFKEYYGAPEATEKAFDADGWFDTGDVILVTDDGYLLFGDRDKDMLKVGGENVAASEIEAVILQSGLVEDCAVVGQPHYMLDEVPVAFVVPKEGPTDHLARRIIDYCGANLADFKVVSAVYMVDRLPRGLLEKISKTELRERLAPIMRDASASATCSQIRER